MATLNEKFNGLGNTLYTALPEDTADANKALARALGQIKTVFNLTTAQVGQVAATLETTKGLDLINNSGGLDQDVIDFYKNNIATGSGQNGELLLTDVIGTAAGWVHEDELNAEADRLATLNALGELDDLQAWPTPQAYNNSGNGLYTVLWYHWVQNAYYTPIVNPFDPEDITPQWTIPGTITLTASKAGVYSSKLALSDAVVELVNTEIQRIANSYPLQAGQSVTAFTNMGNQMVREKTNQAAAGIVSADTQTGTKSPVQGLVSNLHSIGQDTSLGGSAYVIEKLADTRIKGGQAVIASMREGRNIQKLAEAGIPTSLFANSTSKTTEQATLLTSTYTVDEAKADASQ
jgi:hypothetical protein